ncbi:MAG: HypC/HybG/HupF family hydrogenase formation chaperone, partial [Desulfovibrio sp.]|nr:HypC/HybG/HupF family hydrogenase formation chaperone [Desulfovibrio sp.]
KVGDYLIVHAGFALHSLTPLEAEESLAAFREIAKVLEEEDRREAREAQEPVP